MRLTCQADDDQCAIEWVAEPIPCGVARLGYSPVRETRLGLNFVCLMDYDIGECQSATIHLPLLSWDQLSKVNNY